MTRLAILHRRSAPASDSGATTVEAAILLPFLMLLMLLVVQAALWYHSTALAKTTAHKAVDAARVEQGTEADAHETARQFLANSEILRDRDIHVDRTADTARVTVSGDVVSLVFGVPLPRLTVTAEAPVERSIP